MTELPLVDSGFAVPVFSLGDDPIASLNKTMAFLTAVASSRFLSTNNQLKTSTNLRNQAIIQDGRFMVQQVKGRQGQSYSGEGHMARQCTQPKRPMNAAWYKDKAMLAEAYEVGQILDKEQLAVLADQGFQMVKLFRQSFQTMLLFRLMISILMILTVMISRMQKRFSWPIFPTIVLTLSQSSVFLILQETQLETVQDTTLQAQQDSMILSVIEQMSKQMINHVNNWEKANKEQNNESVTAELE
ncbi:hypothetical protein Tco_0863419 [Tanacetum coccineum]